MPQGYLCLVLHAHLPYVRHPEFESFLEEDWYFEAVTETYVPLLDVMERLTHDGVPFRLTMSLSPTLVSMFVDPLLQERFLRHLDSLIRLANREVERTALQPEFNRLALMYRDHFLHVREVFAEKCGRNLVHGFRRFQEMGVLEIITCAATHGFLPLMDVHRNAVRAQIQIAVEHYQEHFGRPPRGIWLPECGYHPGHDEILAACGIKFFFVETHGILHGSPRPRYGVYAPVLTPAGVAVFGRDVESSKQVWSQQEGYPGDFNYREFYRDVGWDLDYDYIRPYLNPDGARKNLGIKYYRITGKTEHKEVYNPDAAREKAAEHAGNFMFNRERQVEYLYSVMGRKPIVVAPYDAELFGHWWFEGPQWLEFLLRKIAYDQDIIRTITPSEYLQENPTLQVLQPCLSTWGYKGYNEVWLNGANDWIYRHLHKAAERMIELARAHPHADGLTRRALQQAARELLLAQSSDWAFIMKTGTMTSYAVKRTHDHLARFTRLYHDLQRGTIDETWLREVEWKDNIFPRIDYRVYA
ncbi:MAG: DUF1957 domain-containing protein [Abditibacteriales bacterium]|nr:DUF1957 domain-containing protein [Abditibacteriales bacterium]MDW8367160.1 DUF1957 domain-containing protein [Abditibacteriales bacterium]